MPSFLIRGLARYAAASAMERRERRRSSYTPSSETPSDDDQKLSEAELAGWQTQMRWLLPFVQATGHRIVIENPKSHEQIIIDQNTQELPELTLEWMQKYNKQELLEWIAKEKERHIKEEEEKQKKLQARRIAEIQGRERFGSSFMVDEPDVKENTNNSQNTNIKGIGNYIIPILTLYIIILFLVGLWVYKSPFFTSERYDKDRQKYNTIMLKAENSPISEIVTPEGFRFDMNEDQFFALNEQRKSYIVGYTTKYVWQFGDVHYAGEINSTVSHEGKLCSYDITIHGQFVDNNSSGLTIMDDNISELTNLDVNNICDYYKSFLEKNYTFIKLSDFWLGGGNAYVFTKSNMAITIRYEGYNLKITCENRPVSAPIEREKERAREEMRKTHRYVPPNPYAYP